MIEKSRNQNNATTQETHMREREGNKAMRVGRINQQPVPKASPPAAAT